MRENMRVEFRRTGERSYAVKIHRGQSAPVVMDPAPGYDLDMPHDLLHLVVESELRLSRGIFGQIAAGGTAGTFHPRSHASSRTKRDVARDRRRIAKRGARLLADGRDEAMQSERATYISLHAWLARSNDARRKGRATQMTDAAQQVRATQTRGERQDLKPEVLDRICARLDHLSAQWRVLAIGESLIVEWPLQRDVEGSHGAFRTG